MVATIIGSEQAAEGTLLLAGTEINGSNVLNKNETRKKVSFHGESLDSNLSVDDNMNSDLKSARRVASCCRAAEGRVARKAKSSRQREERCGEPRAAEGGGQENPNALTARRAETVSIASCEGWH
jgi:hypothetical protein